MKPFPSRNFYYYYCYLKVLPEYYIDQCLSSDRLEFEAIELTTDHSSAARTQSRTQSHAITQPETGGERPRWVFIKRLRQSCRASYWGHSELSFARKGGGQLELRAKQSGR
jgi:hypothetical protein